MFGALDYALRQLPELLEDPELWETLVINRRRPHTYRVWTMVEYRYKPLRICLHRFEPCTPFDAFAHPHPWPGAFFVLKGRYKQRLWTSPDRYSAKVTLVSDMILDRGSSYLIDNPLVWHSVQPLETSWTIMVNGEPWDKEVAHVEAPTTAGKDLDRMTGSAKLDHLDAFKKMLLDK